MSDERDYSVEPPEEPVVPPAAAAYEVPASDPATEIYHEPVPPSSGAQVYNEARPAGPAVVVPEKRSNRTVWIVVIVALVMICCCCLVIAVAAVLFLAPVTGTQWDMWNLLPQLWQFI